MSEVANNNRIDFAWVWTVARATTPGLRLVMSIYPVHRDYTQRSNDEDATMKQAFAGSSELNAKAVWKRERVRVHRSNAQEEKGDNRPHAQEKRVQLYHTLHATQAANQYERKLDSLSWNTHLPADKDWKAVQLLHAQRCMADHHNQRDDSRQNVVSVSIETRVLGISMAYSAEVRAKLHALPKSTQADFRTCLVEFGKARADLIHSMLFTATPYPYGTDELCIYRTAGPSPCRGLDVGTRLEDLVLKAAAQAAWQEKALACQKESKERLSLVDKLEREAFRIKGENEYLRRVLRRVVVPDNKEPAPHEIPREEDRLTEEEFQAWNKQDRAETPPELTEWQRFALKLTPKEGEPGYFDPLIIDPGFLAELRSKDWWEEEEAACSNSSAMMCN